jgi:tripartite-type tricarboxylate transporter receptor subunit TctC
VIATLVKHIHAMQDDPEIRNTLAQSGLEALKESPAQFGARMRNDNARFRDIVKAAKLKPE